MRKENIKLLISKCKNDPNLIIPGFFAWVNGIWHKIKFKIFMKNIKIGKWFRVYGKFRIMGRGKVIIGDNCFIQSKIFGVVTFITKSTKTKITIGNNVGFSGTVMQTFKEINIADWCNIADAYIVDSSVHSLNINRRLNTSNDIKIKPIYIGKNVWISTKVIICQGVHIGDNCVIGAASLIRNDIPENSFYAGNPVKFIKTIS